MSKLTIGEHEFHIDQELIEATRKHRPDTAWKFVDQMGHTHVWHEFQASKPATSYDPSKRYDVPSLIWVKDGEEYWEDDDEPHPVGHLECRQCGEHVNPGYRADDTVQYVSGIKRCYIDGQSVLEPEFRRRIEEALKAYEDSKQA